MLVWGLDVCFTLALQARHSAELCPASGVRMDSRMTLKYELNGTSAKYAAFDGNVLNDIRLTAGHVAIFRIDP
jgi:hypothetical protein